MLPLRLLLEDHFQHVVVLGFISEGINYRSVFFEVIEDCEHWELLLSTSFKAQWLFTGDRKAAEEHWVYRILADAPKDKLYFVQRGRADIVLLLLKPKSKSGTKLLWPETWNFSQLLLQDNVCAICVCGEALLNVSLRLLRCILNISVGQLLTYQLITPDILISKQSLNLWTLLINLCGVWFGGFLVLMFCCFFI